MLVSQWLRDQAPAWFPEVDWDRAQVRTPRHEHRLRGSLIRAVIDDGSVQRQVLVKMRRPEGVRGSDRVPSARPEIYPSVYVSESRRAALEFHGLQVVAAAVAAAADQRLTAVRPLLLDSDKATVVMVHLDGDNLRTLLHRSSIIEGHRVSCRSLEDVLSATGAWLAMFHATSGRFELSERQLGRDEVVDLIGRLARFIAASGGPDVLRRLADPPRGLAEQCSAEFPTAVRHGDFAPRNVLVTRSGQVAAIDLMPRWQSPVHDDLARMLMSLRLARVQIASRGAAFPRRWLTRYEDAFVRGYKGEPSQPPDLLLFRLLVLLDQWAGVTQSVSRRSGMSARLHLWRKRFVEPLYAGEAERLVLLLLGGPTGAISPKRLPGYQ